jgi:type II secretory pathway pseudopilin PulG
VKKYALSLEIALAIVAIALIIGVILPAYSLSKDKAKEGEVKNNLHEIQGWIERYAVDREGEYPAYLVGGNNLIPPERELDTSLSYDAPYWAKFFPDRTSLSDPLLRNGYLDSYPKNPFVSEQGALDISNFQLEVGDPLRVSPDGDSQGYRFGWDCTFMGNVSCDYRYPTFKATSPDGTVAKYPTGADFEGYPFFDVWTGRKPKFYLPGEFFYKSMGPVMAADPDEVDKDHPIQPVEVDQYIMGAYGSLHTRGFDVLGPEPLIRGFTTGSEVTGVPAIPHGADGSKLFPFHTRWTNTPDENGRYQGSPYGETTDNLISQITAGNPNGIKVRRASDGRTRRSAPTISSTGGGRGARWTGGGAPHLRLRDFDYGLPVYYFVTICTFIVVYLSWFIYRGLFVVIYAGFDLTSTASNKSCISSSASAIPVLRSALITTAGFAFSRNSGIESQSATASDLLSAVSRGISSSFISAKIASTDRAVSTASGRDRSTT